MKINYLCIFVILLAAMNARGQTPVSVGAGSYASFPPSSQTTNQNGLDTFITRQKIYVAENKKNMPIPTNDWWTDLIINGKNAGQLWAYPLVPHPRANGFSIQFPNKLIANGGSLNMDGGVSMTVTAPGYVPDKAIAKDWSDWGLVISLPDSAANKGIDVTMAHGVPFTWVETHGINPAFSFDRDAVYLNSDGSPLQFPTTRSFVVQTDGKYFGIHLDGKASAMIEGQQYVILDLGTSQSISKISLNWENAYASAYSLQTSNDEQQWNTIYTRTGGTGGLENIDVSGNGRYVKLVLTERGSNFGYSLFEFQVFNGATLISQNVPVEVSSTQDAFIASNINDGNTGTRWGSDFNQKPGLVLNTGNSPSFFVISALTSPADLDTFENYAFNKVTDTKFAYNYDIAGGKVAVNWNVTTVNLKGEAPGNTLQGFLPHLYADAANTINFTPYNYVTNHGTLKTAVGSSFSFTWDFGGVLPGYNAPFRDSTNAHPYDAKLMFDMISQFAKRNDFADDTYWGGKDLVNFAKYTLMAKQTNHQAFEELKEKTKQRLVDWLTYTPSEPHHYFARYDRWGALIGFDQSYGSAEFTDNHFHYGYLMTACALYGMVDPEFLTQYGDMIKLVGKQYANWQRNDTWTPYFRTLDPWIGHSYAGGTSSGSGNNQESSSEAMQSWIGLFLVGDMLGDQDMRAAGAFGYTSESYSVLEYWFDWKRRNFPPDYAYKMAAIVSNQGSGHQTFFGDSPIFVHGIEYLPILPGFKYFARDTTWAASEYADLMQESLQREGKTTETQFGLDWANVALGFKQFSDPGYVAAYIENNVKLPANDPNNLLNEKTTGITYYYTHADQNLGTFSFKYHTDFPSSSVFEKNGKFAYAVAYNPGTSDKTCNIFDNNGKKIGSFNVAARQLVTYPTLPTTGNSPDGCYISTALRASASSGNAAIAIDGDQGSRWESAFSDPQYITIDLGVLTRINQVTLSWENASAKNYYLLGSVDSLKWDTIAVKTNMPLGARTDTIGNLNLKYRYLQMLGTARNTPYGYSIYEFQVCGSAADSDPAVQLPALIEAESFTAMSGLQVETNNDAGGGQDVGYTDVGDWMEYRVNAPSAGKYLFKFRVASPQNTGKIELLSDGISLGFVTVPNTGGWQNYASVLDTVFLKQGVQTLRLSVAGAGFNTNWINISQPKTTFGRHIEAESFIAQQGIQTEPTNDIEGGLDVGYIDPGDWLDYHVDIPAAGDYKISYRVASPYDSGIIQFQSGSAVLATTSIPDTKGYQNWVTVITTVHFSATGPQTFRLSALGGNFNINWLDVDATDSNAFSMLGTVKSFASAVIQQDQQLPTGEDPVIYPNPASGTVNLLYGKSGPYFITDKFGKTWQKGNLSVGKNTLDISTLTPGLYIFRIKGKGFKLLVN